MTMASGDSKDRIPRRPINHSCDDSEPVNKKLRTTNSIYTNFPGPLQHKLRLAAVYFLDTRLTTSKRPMRGMIPSVVALKLLSCNASDSSASFSRATCKVERASCVDPLALLFKPGLDVLTNYLRYETPPENPQHRLILSKLLDFVLKNDKDVMGNDDYNPLENLHEYPDETDLTVVLVNHLFGKLSTSEHFIIDNHYKLKMSGNCPCRTTSPCRLTGEFGDTSIGNPNVWHGNVDIIVNNALVLQTPKASDDHSPGRKSQVEVKTKHGSLQLNQQLIAESIVFSFLRKQRHPENDHFLVPCVGITGTDMVIYFYDSEHDVLLESCQFSLIENHQLNLVSIITAWLVVNYRYTSNGLKDFMLSYKSDFVLLPKQTLEIYENSLKFGYVGKSGSVAKPVFELPYRPAGLSELEKEKDIIVGLFS